MAVGNSWAFSISSATRIKSSVKASDEVDWVSSILYPLSSSNCSWRGFMMELNKNGDRGSPCFTPLRNCTSTREPLYSMFVFIDTYELIIEERSVEGIPSLRRAGSMALRGIVSKAFEMSSCINTSPCRDLARRSISLSACMLLKHPGSDTKPFCL